MKHGNWFWGLVGAIALASGCETTGIEAREDSGPPDPTDASETDGDTGSEDAGERMLTRFTYTPEGCYEVSTPELDEAGMSEDVFGDAPSPNHIHVSWAGPSHTSFAVNWHTGLDTLASRMLYGTDRDAVAAADGAGSEVTEQIGHHMMYGTGGIREGMIGAEPTRVHEAHVCGLDPDTTYYYKVGGPGNWSEVKHTTTAPVPGTSDPWSFAVTGDSRNQQENSWAISQRKISERGVDLQLFSGDAVFVGTLQEDWDALFTATDGDFVVEDFMAEVPFMMANGNHDNLAVNYVAQFAYPQEVSPGELAQGEEWYSFDYANAHFIMLNDTVADEGVIAGEQAAWLREDLASVDREQTPWVFAVHHRPFYTCLSTHSPDTGLRQAWQPLFDDYDVDMVFTGHNHVYERSLPIRGLEGGQGVVAANSGDGLPTIGATGKPSGTVYIVSAGVGAPLYDVSDECEFTHKGEQVRSFVHVEIDDRTITYTATDAMTDRVIDEFTYSK